MILFLKFIHNVYSNHMRDLNNEDPKDSFESTERPAQQGTFGSDTHRLIGATFPLLSQQPGLSNDIRDDLSSTDNIFGSRHKRGKSARLEALENMENRLELAVLRNKVAQNQVLIDQLQFVLSANGGGLGQLFSIPINLEQAEAVFRLSFLRLGRPGPEFTLNPQTMMNKLSAVTTDDVSIEVLRQLIINISDSATPQDLAAKYGRGRQSIYDRQNRMTLKLDALIADSEFSELIQYLQSTTCVVRSSQITASLAHPLAAILLLPPNDFPSIHDLVAVAFWGIARLESNKRRSFRRTIRDGDEWIVC